MTNGVNMIEILNKVKDFFIKEDLGMVYTSSDVINSVKSIFQRELSQLQKMKREVTRSEHFGECGCNRLSRPICHAKHSWY